MVNSGFIIRHGQKAKNRNLIFGPNTKPSDFWNFYRWDSWNETYVHSIPTHWLPEITGEDFNTLPPGRVKVVSGYYSDYWHFHSKNTIDLSKFKKLYVKIADLEMDGSYETTDQLSINYVHFIIYDTNDKNKLDFTIGCDYYHDERMGIYAKKENHLLTLKQNPTIMEFDISNLQGPHYIGIDGSLENNGGHINFTLSDIWLK